MITPDHHVDTARLVAALPDIKVSFRPAGADGVQHTLLNGEDVEREIRDMEVSSNVSQVAEIPDVRREMGAQQQAFGEERGIVMDGRDIGTTVFPNAEMKVFVEASPEERARRRLKELEEKGLATNYEEVLANIRERDHIDSTREVSPLRRASDAFLLNNDNLNHQQQMQILLDLYDEKSK